MRWRDRRRSSNVEDRRGQRPRMGFPGRGRIGLPRGRGIAVGGGGLGLLLLLLVVMLLGGDPLSLLQGLPTGEAAGRAGGSTGLPSGGAPGRGAPPAAGDEGAQFVSVVLAETEDVWHALFRGMKRRYREPRLVLFTDAVRSACGITRSQVGPFYCPGDLQVYIDLAFYDELQRRLGAPGDFAQAYVIAHEVGHHVQKLLGISDQIDSARRRAGEREANALSVKMELQADCFAGVWAHHADRVGVLEEGDLREALGAASAIGDDRIQKRAQGYVVPDSFTHGSSEQRVRWFQLGHRQGDPAACDTFAAREL